MDTDFFVYFDDVDFSIRARAAGFQYWLTGDLTIIHKASSLTGGFLGSFTLRWLTRNWVLTSRKHLSLFGKLKAFTYMQAWMLARLLVGRDKASHYVKRQKAFFEGMVAPVSDDGSWLSNSELISESSPIGRIVRKEAARNVT
ncbi:glycosyltransferase family 2 protein [Arthrobacter sp. MMS18-M83]|uniref:glycosyltransferase family 2 protein n=1 Tax=Arthrobacter sp. MMS18-M83 TaxID=2996261 RepID=UPI00227B0A27|nr:hypothetical protein [Arthrobacter sp. MMS18-M83]WAH95908.1 hypothetical protein OW521_15875 [Arthrobacter sp. MMS18-M83]